MRHLKKRLARGLNSGKISAMKIGMDRNTNSFETLKQKLAAPLKCSAPESLLAVALLVSGCASQPPIVLAPVGPAPMALNQTAPGNGALMVYSPLEAVANLSADISGQPSDDWEYSDYRILSPDGKRLKWVANNAGTVQLHPQTIALPAGNYRVVAQADGGIRVTVPVVIASHQTTVLHLDGHDFPPGETGFNQTNSVRLPDGRIVGWRAAAQNVPAS
jgi:hypothetical protein